MIPADKIWLHDLRNAINSASVAVEVVRRALEASDPECAKTFIGHAQEACRRSSDLLAHPGDIQNGNPTPGDIPRS